MPKGKLMSQTIAMSVNTNSQGDIFGGWILSQMDLAAGTFAQQLSHSRCATVAIDALSFRSPVRVGDTIGCYAELIKIGRSSLEINIEVWRTHYESEAHEKVTEGIFTFVAINESHTPHPADPIRRQQELKS